MTKYTKAQRRLLRNLKQNPHYRPQATTTERTLEICIQKGAVEKLPDGRLKLLVDPDELPLPFSSTAADATRASTSPSKRSKTSKRSGKK